MTKHTYPRFSARKKNRDLMTLLTSDSQFQEEVGLIRKMPSPYSKYSKDEDVMLFVRAVAKLCDSFHLPKNFYNNIQEYIITGEISFPLNNFGVIPSSPLFGEPHPKKYAKLSKKEEEDYEEERSRFEEDLPTIGSIRNLDKMLESEKFYKECEEYNKSDNKEYNLTLKERLSGGKTKVKKVYEDKRMLDDHRKKQFGKI